MVALREGPATSNVPGREPARRVKTVETFTRGQLGVVRVRTEDGAEGYGQLSTFNADVSAMVMHRQVARYALGQNPLDADGIVDRCIEGNYKYPGSYVRRALAGLDTALWDLRGKLEGSSVCELIGGTPRPFPVYGSSMRRDIRPEQEAERLAALKESSGYRAFKIRVGKVCGHDEDQWPGRTEALIPAVRRAIGDETSLLADGNSCYTPERAVEVGRLLEQYGGCHFEEPCPYWELEWTAEVSKRLDIPVAGGEQDCFLWQWRRIVRMRAVDIVQPDICYIGGLTRALRVARIAQQAGLPCIPHSANRSLVTVFTLHMMGAIPNAGPYVEFSIEPARRLEDFYSPALEVRDGCVQIPDGPGWGVEIDPDWLRSAEHQVSESAA